MVCVEVLVNGRPACTADSYLNYVMLEVHSPPSHLLHNLQVSGFADETADLAPKLRAALQKPMRKQIDFLNRKIQPGDEITIRVVDRS